MRSITVRGGFGLAFLVTFATAGSAIGADQLIPGVSHTVETATAAEMISRPVSGLFALPASDPRVNGGTLQILDTGGASPPMLVALPASGWTALGTPAGTLGYAYNGAGTPADPCRSVIVSPASIEFACVGAGVSLDPPFAGDAGVVLTVAIDTRYCAAFGGTTVRNQDGLLIRLSAPPPAACASPTSTTTTTIPGGCCNNAMAVSFFTVDSPGDCGDLITAGGTPTVTNLACAGLYTGGGGNSVPLPYSVPDRGFAINAITACTGQTATLAATTSTATGSNRNCTASGCLFGAPLAVPNSNSTPTSVCVLNSVSGTAAGTLTCDTGATNLALPLSAEIFLTGDSLAGQAGIQPCAVCRGSAGSETCLGGPNNGMTCTPGTTDLSGDPSYPTSHDCPPEPSTSIGSLPINFNLSTGTVTWTGTVATNDTGSTASSQTRVFAGYCRDVALPGGSGAFKGTSGATAQQCWENGMAIGSACGASDSFESCEQRTTGAFGPNGGANRTVRVIGNSMSVLAGPAFGTLVSIFSIPPTFNATIDSAGDLPGAGAVSLPGTANLCPTAGTCP